MKKKLKQISKALLLCSVLYFTSCVNDDFIIEQNLQNPKNYQIQKISFKEIKTNRKAFEKLKESRLKKNPSLQFRGVYNEDYEVFIDTTNIILVENGDKHSLTFQIVNEEQNNTIIENLVLNSKDDGGYSAFITEYNLTQQDLIKLANGETLTTKTPSSITEIENLARLNVGGDGADCIDISIHTVSMCRDSNGNTIYNNGELGNGCVGMPFDVEYMVMTIDSDCLSGGGGGSSGGGYDGGGDYSGPGNTGGGSGSTGGGGSSDTGNTGTTNTGNPPSGGNTDNPTNADPTLTDSDGNPILTTPILTTGRKNHIEELNKITTQNENGTNGLRNYIDQLVEEIDDPIEQGMEFKLNNNGSYSSYPAQSNGIDGTNFPLVSVNNPLIRMHKHHTGLNPVFSAEDVLGMVAFFIQKKNLNPDSSDNNNITSIMVSEDGVHALRISNPTELIEFNSYYSTPEDKNALILAYLDNVIKKSRMQCGGNCSDEEYKNFLFQNFVKFIKSFVWGIDFYYAPHPVNNDENYEWTKQN